MPKITNPEVKRMVKETRLNGGSGKESLLAGGLTEITSTHNVGKSKLLIAVDQEIEQEFKASQITVESVLKRYIDIINIASKAFKKTKNGAKFLSIIKECNDSFSKYLQMFGGNTVNVNMIDLSDKPARLNRLKRLLNDKMYPLGHKDLQK